MPAAANVAAGSLLFGQVLTGRPYSTALALTGAMIWILFTTVAFVLAAGE